jgi:hypothetical protein
MGLMEDAIEANEAPQVWVELNTPRTHGWTRFGGDQPLAKPDAEKFISGMKDLWGPGDYEFRMVIVE